MTETLKLTIHALVAGGRGLGKADGVPVFVPGSAPGDVVRVRVTRRHKSYCEAEIEEMIEPSPARVTPRCPVFDSCGGCQWQHLSYAAQIEWKQTILAEQLRRLGGIAEPNVLPTIEAKSPWNYRSRIQLQIDKSGRAGFYRRGSHDVIEFDECAIAAPAINERLAAAKEHLRKQGKGRHLRVDGGKGFSQVNPEQNEQLQQLVKEGVHAHGGGRVLELYCGNGNLTFPIAEVAETVIGVDDYAGAIRHAKSAAKRGAITNVEFHATSALRMLDEMLQDELECDGVILDPPRRGAAEAIAALIELAPRWIGYISCDPATLARDLKSLLAAGYNHESSQPIDMFPQTFHIESLTWLNRSE